MRLERTAFGSGGIQRSTRHFRATAPRSRRRRGDTRARYAHICCCSRIERSIQVWCVNGIGGARAAQRMSLVEAGGQGHHDPWACRRAPALRRLSGRIHSTGPSKYRCRPASRRKAPPKSGSHPPRKCFRLSPEGQEAKSDHEQTDRGARTCAVFAYPLGWATLLSNSAAHSEDRRPLTCTAVAIKADT